MLLFPHAREEGIERGRHGPEGHRLEDVDERRAEFAKRLPARATRGRDSDAETGTVEILHQQPCRRPRQHNLSARKTRIWAEDRTCCPNAFDTQTTEKRPEQGFRSG
jgi:hypothetical protein